MQLAANEELRSSRGETDFQFSTAATPWLSAGVPCWTEPRSRQGLGSFTRERY